MANTNIFSHNLIKQEQAPKVTCAYSTHNGKAWRVAVFESGSRLPLCLSHRAGEIRGFVRWEKLAS